MNKGLFSGVVSILFLIVFLPLAWSNEAHVGPCSLALEHRFTDKVVSARPIAVSREEVERITGVDREFHLVALRTENGGEDEFNKEADLFNDVADLSIGIDVTGTTQGHLYLIVRMDDGTSARYDGRLFRKKHRFRRDRWRLSNGVLVRYLKIPEENRRRLVDFLLSGDEVKAYTCVASGCKILFDIAGFSWEEGRARPWFPGPLLRQLARNGLVGADGERLVPEIYTINEDYHDFWNDLPTWRGVWRYILPLIPTLLRKPKDTGPL